MYQIAMDTRMREYAVLHALRVLQKNGEYITLNDIADEAQCHRNTAQKAIQHLLRIGAISRKGSKKTGYVYTIGDDDDRRSAS